MNEKITQTSERARPKVAVVVGAIGIRAAAAIPLFEFLDEAGIEVDLLIGASGGALMTAMRGAGISTSRMREIVGQMRRGKLYSRIDYRTLLGFAHPKLARPGIGSGLKLGDRQQRLYQEIFGARRLEDLRPTTLLQATDCVAGEGVVLNAGPLAEAVFAASTMAPEFPPIKVEGRWLVDGAYTSPVPVLEAVKRHADVIITLFHQEEPKPHPEDLLEANYNILAAYFSRLVKDQTMLSIELHHHEIILAPITFETYIGPWETRALSTAIEAGERIVADKKDEIRRAIANFAGAAN
ncbi:MAG: patatin-like phospholipase family protein [Blastocatellia bacterium]|nr:patatin-like phospholipase family protein [Blastocatellia bacterium]